ncbi:MAG: hypothetical protein NTX38_10640 [Methylobacter sp.]|nr:hypothetical protein [Methylobacter sp.]
MDEILTINQTYYGLNNPIGNVFELVRALNLWYKKYPEHNFLHPCVIDGKAALVCQRNLSQIDEQAHLELEAIADQFQLFLKQDCRTPGTDHEYAHCRRNIALVLTFCVVMVASSRRVSAGDFQKPAGVGSVSAQLSMQTKTEPVTVGENVISLRNTRLPTAEQVMASYAKQKPLMKTDAQAEVKIRNFLISAYQPEAADPTNINADIVEIAKYYAQYPEVINLLNELNQQKVVLKYKANNWQAQAWGNQHAVDSVTITFDTRVGAQLLNNQDCQANPACDISPADALLHELLHAKLMLLESQHFIDEGNMEPNLYPFEHEREVLLKENQLYAEMNQDDGLSRPLRTRHTGELFHVNCTACTPNEMIASR